MEEIVVAKWRADPINQDGPTITIYEATGLKGLFLDKVRGERTVDVPVPVAPHLFEPASMWVKGSQRVVVEFGEEEIEEEI